MKYVELFKPVKTAIVVFALMGTVSAFAADKYSFDKKHTEIRFNWNHLGISTQSARFMGFDGTFMIDQENPNNSSVEVSFDSNSIKSADAGFDVILASPRFFDAAKFPKSTFKSTSVKQTGKSFAEITGDLTIKGITKSVTLEAELLFMGQHPLGKYIANYKGVTYTGFKAKAQILRSDFGLGEFAPLTSDRIIVEINTELRKAKPQ